MPFRFDTEEEQEDLKKRRSKPALGGADGSDTEIALGTRSLLAIFFGLVLICSVFFGLGYSVGRAGGTRAPERPATETATAAPDSHLSKPSPDQSLTPVDTPANIPSDNNTENPSSPSEPRPSSAASTSATPPAPAPSAPAAKSTNPFQSPVPSPATTSATMQPAAATLPANFMVQVAAVRVPQDAQILVDALRKHGYSAVVRNDPQDQLLHIQLGPFPARGDAIAMRAKLLSDGYNAVVK